MTGAGGEESGARRRIFSRVWVLAAVVLLLAATAVAFNASRGEGEAGPRLNTGYPANGDHWHVAFGVYQCDHFVADPVVRGPDWPDPTGIHSHDDGFIHVHPFIASAAGEGARLGVFFETMDLMLTDKAIELTNGATLRTGDQCNGRSATLKVARFDVDDVAASPTIVTSDLPDIRLRDRQALTLALVVDGSAIPSPPNASLFDELTDVGSNLFPTTSKR